MDTKQSLRRRFRAQRDALSIEEREAASAAICEQLLKLPAILDAKSWFVYVSTASEVSTHELIRKLLEQSRIVAVPRVVSANQMIAQPIRSFEELSLGAFGILEPKPNDSPVVAADIAICPGAAFTIRGDRLGSGGGFYDRFLAANSPRLAIGLAFECQIAGSIPVEAFDRPMDFIITEQRVIERHM